jgi:hypothetical protein
MDKFLRALTKKIVIFALCLNAQLLFADNVDTKFTLLEHRGFYVGGDIGLANLMDSESHRILPESHQLGATGIIGGVLFGYDYAVAQNWMFGMEGFFNANGLNMMIQRSPYSYKQKSRYNFGFRVLPKYLLTDNTDAHLILGYTTARFNINDNGVYGMLYPGSFNLSGFQGGFGFNTAIMFNLFVRLDAIYASYTSRAYTGIGSNLSPSINQVYYNKFSSLEGTLSLIYKFG